MHDPCRHAIQGDLEGLDDIIGGNTVEAGLFAIHPEEKLSLVCFHHVVDVHDPVCLMHPVLDLPCSLDQFVIGMMGLPVYLGHEGGKNRRTGWCLHQFDTHTGLCGNGLPCLFESSAPWHGSTFHGHSDAAGSPGHRQHWRLPEGSNDAPVR